MPRGKTIRGPLIGLAKLVAVLTLAEGVAWMLEDRAVQDVGVG
jgi:hypothetical protein